MFVLAPFSGNIACGSVMTNLKHECRRDRPDPSQMLQAEDFDVKINQSFPRSGSSTAPPHAAADFKWKDYSPVVFRKLRERFAMDAGEFMLSLCGA